jgi:hypothetical protein
MMSVPGTLFQHEHLQFSARPEDDIVFSRFALRILSHGSKPDMGASLVVRGQQGGSGVTHNNDGLLCLEPSDQLMVPSGDGLRAE